MSVHNNYIAIMAGGIGSRFWPHSRIKMPKQFLDLLGTGKSLLQATYERCKNLCPISNLYIITNIHYKEIVQQQLPDLPEENIAIEPFRRNTAPAAAYITAKIQSLNPNANLIFTPSDHLITEERAFERSVHEAFNFVAQKDALLTFGIKPNRPDTSYGYIQYQNELPAEENDIIYKVKTFTEKPNLDLARTFLKSGDFLWNSGILAWNVTAFTKALERHLPDLSELITSAQATMNTQQEQEIMTKVYTQCTNISIDYGIMEKANNVYVIPSYFGWSDLGNWESVYSNVEKDYLGNAVFGKNILIIDANESFIQIPKEKLAVIQGLENFIVIDTPEVLLICERNHVNQIKDYIAEVKRNFGETFL